MGTAWDRTGQGWKEMGRRERARRPLIPVNIRERENEGERGKEAERKSLAFLRSCFYRAHYELCHRTAESCLEGGEGTYIFSCGLGQTVSLGPLERPSPLHTARP